MTYKRENTAIERLSELLSEGGDERFLNALELLLNTAMVMERSHHLQASPYERTELRNGLANGFKDRTLSTRLGELNLRVPQVRDSEEPFYPKSLERGQRSERALKLAVAEMYVQGVSTRKVAAITKELCGFDISTASVSRASSELDAILQQWRDRPLGQCPYVCFDAIYIKVRQNGAVRDAASLVATGVDATGKRSILGCSVSISENEIHWRNFMTSLVERGLCGVKMIVSDAHEGMAAARKAVFGGVLWQRCQFHLQQNAQKHAPRQSMKSQIAADIRAVFNAESRDSATSILSGIVKRWREKAPKLADWMEAKLPEGLNVFVLPKAHQRLMRTSNALERVNKEIRRRTRVVGVFPNEESCLRLVTAVLMEISDEWEAGKAYLTFRDEDD